VDSHYQPYLGGTAIGITNGANSIQVINEGVTAFTVSSGQSQITKNN
jgi:hypothetical protein